MSELNKLFDVISSALRSILQFFFGFTHDYTLAIVLLTVVVKAVLHPLTRTQLKSMKGMQMVAPHVEALRRKYKEDPRTLNQEIMKLYRAHNLNPMMGCLPMLVQMPVFIALWRLLYTQGLFGNATVFGIPWMRLDKVPTLQTMFAGVAAGHAEQILLLVFPILVGHDVAPAAPHDHGSAAGPHVRPHADHDGILRDDLSHRCVHLHDCVDGGLRRRVPLGGRSAPPHDHGASEVSAAVAGAGG